MICVCRSVTNNAFVFAKTRKTFNMISSTATNILFQNIIFIQCLRYLVYS